MTNPAIRTLDETVLPAGELALPPQRRLMVFFLLALTALLHVAPVGWGPIREGSEGWNAAMARELAVGVEPAKIGEKWGEKVVVTPSARVMAHSFQVFGISEKAARIPFALANLLVVWLVFQIGERLGGMWRGLSSGIIAATSVGAVLLARDGGGAALVAAAFLTALYAAVRMLEQQSRIRWQFLFWSALSLLLALREPLAGLLLVAALLVAGISFRVARYRLRWVWWSVGATVFSAVVYYGWSLGWWLSGSTYLMKSMFSDRAWWMAWVMVFPWSAVLLPVVIFQIRRLARWHDFQPQDVVLWVLAGLTFLWAALAGPVENWAPGMACFWPICALLTGLAWDRATSGMRIVGIALVASLAGVAFFFGTQVAGAEWSTLLRPIWWLSCSVVAGFSIFAIVSVMLRHSRAALLTIAASAIPLAFNLIDAHSRRAWATANWELGAGPESGFVPGSRIFTDLSHPEVGAFLFYAPRGLTISALKNESWPVLGSDDYILARPSKTPVASPWRVVASSPSRILIGSERR